MKLESAPVRIESPRALVLCDGLTYALMLSSLRKIHPRIHYTAPCLASFGRGEELKGDALKNLAEELGQLLEELADTSLEQLVDLRDDLDFNNYDFYQWSHFRGRTFDREKTDTVAAEDRNDFLHRLGLDPKAKNLKDVYGPLLKRIMALAFEASQSGDALKQKEAKHHTAPGLPEASEMVGQCTEKDTK